MTRARVEQIGAGGFFLTGPFMKPRKGFARGWPTKAGMRRLLDKSMVYREVDDAFIISMPEGTEIYRLTANAVHVLARAGGYKVGRRTWKEPEH